MANTSMIEDNINTLLDHIYDTKKNQEKAKADFFKKIPSICECPEIFCKCYDVCLIKIIMYHKERDESQIKYDVIYKALEILNVNNIELFKGKIHKTEFKDRNAACFYVKYKNIYSLQKFSAEDVVSKYLFPYIYILINLKKKEDEKQAIEEKTKKIINILVIDLKLDIESIISFFEGMEVNKCYPELCNTLIAETAKKIADIKKEEEEEESRLEKEADKMRDILEKEAEEEAARLKKEAEKKLPSLKKKKKQQDEQQKKQQDQAEEAARLKKEAEKKLPSLKKKKKQQDEQQKKKKQQDQAEEAARRAAEAARLKKEAARRAAEEAASRAAEEAASRAAEEAAKQAKSKVPMSVFTQEICDFSEDEGWYEKKEISDFSEDEGWYELHLKWSNETIDHKLTCEEEISIREMKKKYGEKWENDGKDFDKFKRYLLAFDNYKSVTDKIKRDKCVNCGRSGKGVELTIDHILALYYGGAHIPENIRILCKECNAKKGKKVRVCDFEKTVELVDERYSEMLLNNKIDIKKMDLSVKENVIKVLTVLRNIYAFHCAAYKNYYNSVNI